MRLLAFLVAAVLGAAAAFLVACGDRNGLIPSTDAASLQSALSAVTEATRSGDCGQAVAAVARANGALLNLPDSVDARLRTRLQRGIRNLEQRVPQACRASQDEPSPTTQTTDTQTTETTTTETTPTETTPTETTPTETVPPETTPTGPQPTVPPPSGDGAGGLDADAK